MAILYRREPNGGFVVGNTETGIASYAYPTSESAVEARRAPVRVAQRMAENQKVEACLRQEPDKAGIFPTVADAKENARLCREQDGRFFARLEEGRADGTTRAVVRPVTYDDDDRGR